MRSRLAQRWPRVCDGVLAAIDWRTSTRRASLEAKLVQRQEAEQRRIVDNFDQFASTLRGALDDADAEGALFSRVEARRHEEVAQFRRDRAQAGGNPIRAARRWIDGLMRLRLALRTPVRRGHTWGHDRHPR
ncbi:MAG TPA: hypothetical protein VNA67_03140 [Pseudonocardiaceae bacterium]|nr:hypothetical protein [Pseudonocardiaceae bacterium]